MNEAEFYQKLKKFIKSLNDDLKQVDLKPSTKLWVDGYLNSVHMLQLLTYLEELIGADIRIDQQITGTFDTMRSIYENYVKNTEQFNEACPA